ncbi:hypothetical protein [Aliterella atlantica]|uniref:PhnA-like protein n=1 Tax=Aliterella atlantica CENA595 TaxID=1618023 RepID=A0A0D8ZMR9_9CYAN|nr:hypothetical protein [Aliterella atlantica]KJH69734.1 hypothetical protein UH38_22270 [Aliterella atlantica CENA595]
MSYVNRPIDDVITEPGATSKVVDYHDRVRWGPIFSGLVVALASQLVLSALGAAIGTGFLSDSGAPRSNAGDVGTGVGIWSIISLLISLFIGGWFTSRACGPMNRSTALLNGTILWATTLALSSWLLASGVSGAFGLATNALSNAAGAITDQVQQQGGVNVPNAPNVTAQDTRNIAQGATNALWSFFFGSLLGLAASMIGAAAGARKPRANY